MVVGASAQLRQIDETQSVNVADVMFPTVNQLRTILITWSYTSGLGGFACAHGQSTGLLVSLLAVSWLSWRTWMQSQKRAITRLRTLYTLLREALLCQIFIIRIAKEYYRCSAENSELFDYWSTTRAKVHERHSTAEIVGCQLNRKLKLVQASCSNL